MTALACVLVILSSVARSECLWPVLTAPFPMGHDTTDPTASPTAAPTNSPTGSPVSQELDETLQEWTEDMESMTVAFAKNEIGMASWIDCVSDDFVFDIIDERLLSFAEGVPLINTGRETITDYRILHGTETVRIVDAYTVELSYERDVDFGISSWDLNSRMTAQYSYNEEGKMTQLKEMDPFARKVTSMLYHAADTPSPTEMENLDLDASATIYGINPIWVVAVVIVTVFTMSVGICIGVCVQQFTGKRTAYKKVFADVDSETD